MASEVRKRPKCSMCGKCCRQPSFGLFMTPGDYGRWKRQGRWDILEYAWVGIRRGYGDLWLDPKTGEELGYCPFLKRVSPDRYICTIQDTKPKVCREFRCEWAYDTGKKGVPFKTESGWTEKARQLGYGKTKNGPPFLRQKGDELKSTGWRQKAL